MNENLIPGSVDSDLLGFLLDSPQYAEDDVILSFFGAETSFGEFKRRVFGIAKRLLGLGLKSGDRVMISLISTPESIELMYACSYLGIVPVLADLRLSLAENMALCEETGARLAFISDFRACELLDISRVPCVEKLVIVSVCDGISQALYALQKTWYLLKNNPYFIKKHFNNKVWEWKRFMAVSPSDLPLAEGASGEGELLFTTSGTTGKRKYVILTSKQINLEVWQHMIRFDFKTPRTAMSVMPLFTCYGFAISVHLPLACGMKLILHPVYEARSLPRAVLKYKPNFFAGVIGHFEELAAYKKAAGEDLSYLKLMIFGGDSCSRERLEAVNSFLAAHGCGAKLLQGYGMTEVTSGAVTQDPDRYVSASVGRPLPLTRICITAPGTANPLPIGQKGEVCLNTPCASKGYFNNPAATERLIKTHADGLEWIHSGDLGWLDEDGNLYVEGRIKSMTVSSSGTKLFLPLLQTAAAKRTGGRCIAFALPDKRLDYIKHIVLFAAPKPGARRIAHMRRLKTELRRELPLYLLPERIVFLRRIPLNSAGKTDMQKLERLAEEAVGGRKHIGNRRLK